MTPCVRWLGILVAVVALSLQGGAEDITAFGDGRNKAVITGGAGDKTTTPVFEKEGGYSHDFRHLSSRSHDHHESKKHLTGYAPQHCNSTLLLVDGRSASGSTAETIKSTSSLVYCHEKETFRRRPPTESALKECIMQAPHGSLVHVKPQHIQGGRIIGLKHHGVEKSLTLRNSFEFFQAAKRSGYTRLVTGYRENILEREISSYELVSHKASAAKVFKAARSLKSVMGGFVKEYDVSYAGALMAGYDIYYYSFTDIVTNTCETITHMVSDYIGCTDYLKECEKEVSHTGTSHLKAPLSERIGNDAARNISSALKGTPYAWMLDAAVNEWPKHIVRPLSSIPMPLLSAGGTEEMRVEYNRRYAEYEKLFKKVHRGRGQKSEVLRGQLLIVRN